MSTSDAIPKSLRSEIALRRQDLQRAAKCRDEVAAELEALRQAHKAEKLKGPHGSTPAPPPPQTGEEHKRKMDQTRALIKAKREGLRVIKNEIEDLKRALKQLMHECHKYEPDIPSRSNVAGDPMHLRMPATRSRCWTHAVRLPTRDDS